MIIALIPAFNEVETIGTVVLKAKKHVDKVIVVDDGSHDGTYEIAKSAGAEVIKHDRNGGKGSALKTGFMAVKDLKVDCLVCLDADAQHDPDDIPKVVAPILEGNAEMVIGSRFLNKDHIRCIPRYRRMGLHVLNMATNFCSKSKITDSQSGFRAYSWNTIKRFKFRQTGLCIESEMLFDAIRNDFRLKEVAVSARYDVKNGSSEKPGKHGFGVLRYIMGSVW